MNAHVIVGMEARFTTREQDSRLVLRELPDGCFNVCGTHYKQMPTGFPNTETVKRTGLIFSFDARALEASVTAEVGEQWCHHYHRNSGRQINEWYRYSWSLKIEYMDGTACGWEGADAAPENLETVYETIVSFGMPPLDLPDNSYGTLFIVGPQLSDFDCLVCYERLIRDALGIDDEQDARRELQLLVSELLEDIGQYLRKDQQELDLSEAFRVWGIEPSLSSLAEANVEGAPRVKMMALLGALTLVQDPVEVVKSLQESGVFGRWCERLSAIPYDEARQRERERVEKHEALMLEVDGALRERISAGKVFTSYEVANEIGLTPTQVSARIRRLVRAGELMAVGEGYPRHYKAA